MVFRDRSLSRQESRVVLALSERGQRGSTRTEIVELLGGTPKAADHVIESLRQKGWLERATWGRYLLIPAERGPDILGDHNLLALASRIADPYYIGFSTAAAHYGLTTQHRNVIFVVTPLRLRERDVGESKVRIVNQAESKFFGFEPVDVLGYAVMISDREKTAIDCVDRPTLAGGAGESATILANASRRFNRIKAVEYLEKIGVGVLVRRFGWLMDHVGADVPAEIRDRLLKLAAHSRKTWFGPDPARSGVAQGAIGYDETWRLFVNVTREELHGSAGLGRSGIFPGRIWAASFSPAATIWLPAVTSRLL
jgi:predicted transcriptional regulator of viral defense system